MNLKMFSSEVELSKFLGSIDTIPDAYLAISETNVTYKFHRSRSGVDVLAFNCSPDYTKRFLKGEFDLISSENLPVVDFIRTKEVNSLFSINKAVVELLKHLAREAQRGIFLFIYKPLVVTGQGLGAYLAIFSTLRLQHAIEVEESNDDKKTEKTKRPICITFGSPLIGDKALQHAISQRPLWESSFLNVVATKDTFASCFSSNSAYKPFGTFLFCTESGGHAAFEDQDTVLAVLDTMASSRAENLENLEMYDYGKVFRSFRKKVLYRGVSETGNLSLNSLMEGIRFQFREVGVLGNISSDMIRKKKDEDEKMIKRKRNIYEPTKKLNDMKIKMAYLEWYMKKRRSKGGYYDCYKDSIGKDEIKSKSAIKTHQVALNQYWDWFLKETERKPQTEDAKMRLRWLLNGHNYRRMVEPLDIADYYKKGNRKYLENRHDRYRKLQKMLTEDKKDSNPSDRKKKAASLTQDSCFWAHVEEALISLSVLKNEGPSSNVTDLEQDLVRFEVYVMSAIKDCSVSPDIFLKGSSFMKWWIEYKAYKGSSNASEFVQYMSNESYILYK